LLFARFRKWLARESGTEDIMRRNVSNIYLADITCRFHPEVQFINVLKLAVDLACEDTFMFKLGKCQMESSKASKKVNEFHGISYLYDTALSMMFFVG